PGPAGGLPVAGGPDAGEHARQRRSHAVRRSSRRRRCLRRSGAMMSSSLDAMMGGDEWSAEPVAPTIRVSVAVVEPDPAHRDSLIRQLGDGVTPFDSIEELAGRLSGSVPAVV